MTRFSCVLVACLGLATTALVAQMPDVSQMSGVPLPTNDLPDGTVAIRVVRGDLSNNVVGLPVELHAGAHAQQWTATTDETGRAMFAGIPAGTSVHGLATVNGERLETQEFAVPASGAIRVMLVARGAGGAAGAGAGGAAPAPSGGAASAPAAGSASAPAMPGGVTIGSQSRVIVELVDEAIEVYNVLEFVNTQPAPVDPGKPIVFELPEDARSVTVLENSSPQAKAAGQAVTVTGPFAPGATPIQFAYQLPYASSRRSLRQVMPLGLPQLTLLVRRLPGVQFASAQVGEQREVVLDGHPYVASTGPALAAGQAVEVSFSGLPYHSRWPRWLALALAAMVAAAGVWVASGKTEAAADVGRQKLETRREQLFAELVKLEEQHLAGRGDPHRYVTRRRDLVAQLEQIYSELGDVAPPPQPVGAGRDGDVPVEATLRTGRA